MAGSQKIIFSEEVEEMGMNNAQFNAFLETLAQLIEAKAQSIEDAAEIVRSTKTTA